MYYYLVLHIIFLINIMNNKNNISPKMTHISSLTNKPLYWATNDNTNYWEPQGLCLEKEGPDVQPKENCPSSEKAEAAVLGCGRCFLVSGKGELIKVEEIMKTEG